MAKPTMEQLMAKYGNKLATEFNQPMAETPKVRTAEYAQFKKELLPRQFTYYEKAARFCGNLLKLKLNPKRYKLLTKYIDVSHLELKPEDVESFAYLFPLTYMLLGAFVSFVLFNSLFFSAFFMFSGIAMIFPMRNIPKYMATSWRMKASNQMVLGVFYIVTYMRHTSNLEGAINFAADHLGPPLSLDLKKVVWQVETEKYESVKESLDMYLENWRETNMEFVEAIHLIEGSLFEGSEERRLSLLDKSLDVILNETYEKMLHYAHNLKSPITMLHMMGVILPILGLVILPLVVSFLGEVRWYHIATGYNIILPVGVYLLGKSILSTRPSGYGDTDVTAKNPGLKKYRNFIIKMGKKEIAISPLIICSIILFVCTIIATMPLILGVVTSEADLLAEPDIIEGTGFKFLGYRESSATSGPLVGEIIGPYGLGSALISLFLPIAFGVSIGMYFDIRSRNLMSIREKSKKLENEFGSAMFQLGNRLGDGLPAEIAFAKVAETMEGTTSGKFFAKVTQNVQRLGMGVEEAIFAPERGALAAFPSSVIESSMKVFIESVKKGPKVAAEALINISKGRGCWL